MTPRRRSRWAVAVTAAVLVLAGLATAAPAAALGLPTPPPSTGTPPPSNVTPVQPTNDPSSSGGSGGTKTSDVGTCSVYAGSGGYGVSCPGLGAGGALTTAQILGADAVPGCWDVALTPTELGEYNTPSRNQFTYYWWTCLHGIDPVTKLATGTAAVGREFIHLPVDAPKCPETSDATKPEQDAYKLTCVLSLTTNQQTLVADKADDGQIPTPQLVVSPDNSKTRVNDWTAFAIESGDATAPVVHVGAVQLRAVMTALTVQPGQPGVTLTKDAPPFDQQAKVGDTPASRPDLLWYRYTHSSAGAQGSVDGSNPNRYPAHAVATWVVQISTDGGATWANYTAPFTKFADTPVAVTEIQVLNVPS